MDKVNLALNFRVAWLAPTTPDDGDLCSCVRWWNQLETGVLGCYVVTTSYHCPSHLI